MSIWLHQQSVKAYQSELMREAAHEALIRQALAAHLAKQEAEKHTQERAEDRETLYAPALARIGGWMILAGCYLQTHYGDICACEESPVIQSASAR